MCDLSNEDSRLFKRCRLLLTMESCCGYHCVLDTVAGAHNACLHCQHGCSGLTVRQLHSPVCETAVCARSPLLVRGLQACVLPTAVVFPGKSSVGCMCLSGLDGLYAVCCAYVACRLVMVVPPATAPAAVAAGCC